MRVYLCLSYHKFKHIQMDVLSLSTASNPSEELVSLNRFEKQVMCSVHQLDAEIISHHATMFSRKTDVKNHGKKHQQPFPWFPQSFVSRSFASPPFSTSPHLLLETQGWDLAPQHKIRVKESSEFVFQAFPNIFFCCFKLQYCKQLYFQVNKFHLILIGKLSCLCFVCSFFRLQKLRV